MNPLDDLERLLDCLKAAPGNPRILNDIGVLLYQLKDWKNAEKYLRRAYERNPSDADILFNYASVLYDRLKWRKAVRVFSACLEGDPANPKLLEKLEDGCYQLGQYEKAKKIGGMLQETQRGRERL